MGRGVGRGVAKLGGGGIAEILTRERGVGCKV